MVAAVALDLALGDPRWLPHPVRGIGRLALWIEPWARRLIPQARAAGILAALLVIGTASGLAGLAWLGASRLHPALGDAVAVWIIYTSIAARDLARHSLAVYTALVAGNLQLARDKVSLIVGRDTARLDEAEVVRATVETVGESTLDGVTAPLFFALLGGPVGAMAYRAINTLDSMFGHKDERYLLFGWASARVDDVANFVPARLTGPLMATAAWLLRLNGANAWRILRRDARRHPSPNSGFPEAAMAGALGIRLGGVNEYAGQPEARPFVGEPLTPLAARHIPLANRLMFATVFLFVAVGVASRWLLKG